VIGDSTAIRWAKRWRETGSFEAKSNKGQSRSPTLARKLQRPPILSDDPNHVVWHSVGHRGGDL
jgi:transposase